MMKAVALKSIDHTAIFRRYHGRWVILDASRESVLTTGKTLKQALATFHAHGTKEPFSVLKVPSKLAPFVGSVV